MTCLNAPVFTALAEPRHIVAAWHIDYDTARPARSVGQFASDGLRRYARTRRATSADAAFDQGLCTLAR